MIDWARQNVPGKRIEEARLLFNTHFGLDKGAKAFRSFTKNHQIQNGMPAGLTSGEVDPVYTPEMLDWLADEYKVRTIGDLVDDFNAQFSMNATKSALLGTCKRYGIKSGRDGRFNKGQESWNKGKKMPFNANSAKTQFKKGQRPQNTKYLGHERVSKDGYVEISVAETNPHTGFHRRYVLKHRYLWEQQHGPVPDGMCLKCLDGDKTNCDPSNWECIDRALLPALTRKRNFESLPNEVKPLAITASKLEHKAKQRRAVR